MKYDNLGCLALGMLIGWIIPIKILVILVVLGVAALAVYSFWQKKTKFSF